MGAAQQCCCSNPGNAPDNPSNVGRAQPKLEEEQVVIKPVTPAPQTQAPKQEPKQEDKIEAPYATRNQIEFECVLSKTEANNRIGLNVDIADGQSLVVDKMDGGLIEAWNRRQAGNPDRQVCLGDIITKVNGLTANAAEMTKICKNEREITLTIVRKNK